MTPYGNKSGKSGVVAYEIGDSHIDIQFERGAVYRYTVDSVGVSNFERMKDFARSGSGLNTFIQRNVRDRYHAKIA